MEQSDRRVIGKCFGSAVVGPRGQLVVPVKARRELSIDVSTKLLAFEALQGMGLLFVKVESVEELLNLTSRRIAEFAHLLRDTEPANMKNEDNRGV